MQTIIYTPGGPRHDHAGDRPHRLALTRRMLTEAFTSRELVWQLFLRDFLARYRQSALGVAWLILQPLFLVGLFVAMHEAGVFVPPGLDLPYVPYALTGLALWQIFSGGAAACSVALIEAGGMIGKVNMPRSALIFAAFGGAAAEFLIRLALAAATCLWYGLLPSGGDLVLALLALLPLCLLTLGSGFVLAVAAALFRDVVNATALALSGLLLLTPVLYPLQPDSLLSMLNAWNPLNHLVGFPRDLALRGDHGALMPFAAASLFALLAFATGWRVFFVAQPHISERV